ncbi:MAG: DMT family transporter [Bacteroidota bacterium]
MPNAEKSPSSHHNSTQDIAHSSFTTIRKHVQHLVLLQLAMFCVSTSGPLGRYIALAPPLAIWWRALFAAFFLACFCWWRGYSFQLKGRRQIVAVVGTGVLMAVHWITFFYALQLSNVAVGMLSLMTYPAITALLEPVLLNTKYRPLQLYLGLLILLGVSFLVPDLDVTSNTTQGVLCGIFSASCYALRNIICKMQVGQLRPSILMFYQVVATVMLTLPALGYYTTQTVTDYLLPLLALGLITTAIGHSLFVRSFQYFSVSTASILSSVQPIYGILLAILFLNEFPDTRSILGGICILLTVFIASRRST